MKHQSVPGWSFVVHFKSFSLLLLSLINVSTEKTMLSILSKNHITKHRLLQYWQTLLLINSYSSICREDNTVLNIKHKVSITILTVDVALLLFDTTLLLSVWHQHAPESHPRRPVVSGKCYFLLFYKLHLNVYAIRTYHCLV